MPELRLLQPVFPQLLEPLLALHPDLVPGLFLPDHLLLLQYSQPVLPQWLEPLLELLADRMLCVLIPDCLPAVQ